ncbi:MAG: energy-coupling factor ABC transporter permease [Nitrososphaerota archaeon]|jgi:cobalt/nickel transport system permease protein|nr:energy-coupling factor ABC transporter permease [Nitrososphaerota archaeon]
MHIMEGFLPSPWWQIWWIISLPIMIYGIYKVTKLTKKMPEIKPLLALVGAFVFVISALKLPSLVAGSSSHPTGTGFAAVLFGPAITGAISVIVLVFQALLLAHGGITTLGANLFSMGIAGPAIGFFIWWAFKKARINPAIGVFAATAMADLMTYIITAFQLGLAFPDNGSVFTAFAKFFGIYATTQIPLAIAEGLLAVLLFSFLTKYKGSILQKLGILKIPTSNKTDEVNP